MRDVRQTLPRFLWTGFAPVVLSAMLCAGAAASERATADPSPAPASSPAPAASPVEDPAITARARAEFLAWQSGTLDRSRYSARAATALTDAVVAQVSPQLKSLGDLKSFSFDMQTTVQGDNVYRYTATCAHGAAHMTFALDGQNKIDGILFQPA